MKNKLAKNRYDVIVVGGGAAGLMAGAAAAENGCSVLLLEKEERTGKKILITGKGRCNITNDCEIEDIFTNANRNPRFLYSAVYSFSNRAIIEFFNKLGVETKIERGGRVFPISDKASDVAYALLAYAVSCKVVIKTRKKVTSLNIEQGKIVGLQCGDESYMAGQVILACGGASYPTTGSNGAGYKLAEDSGHTIIKPRSSLTGLNTKESWPGEVMGLTLKNVKLSLSDSGRRVFNMSGELLLTHFGISGPIVLSGSAVLAFSNFKNVKATIDLKPALDIEKLDRRILRDFSKNSRRAFLNSLDELLPSKLIPIIVRLSGIDPYKKVNQITYFERKTLVELLKNLNLRVMGTRSLKEAIVTAGGVDTKEINPKTMESKIVNGLFFCGEMINVDANTGGFNLTIAFATGRLAGLKSTEGCI